MTTTENLTTDQTLVCTYCDESVWGSTRYGQPPVCLNCGEAPIDAEQADAVGSHLFDAYYDQSDNWQDIAENH